MTEDQLYLAVAQSADDTILESRQQVASNFVEGRVCGACNNGWMNDLETEAMEILKPLIAGTVSLVCISDAQRTIVAKWATKTAETAELQSNLVGPGWRNGRYRRPVSQMMPMIALYLTEICRRWSDPLSVLMIAPSIHIPLWPQSQVNIAHHVQFSPLNMSDPMAPLDRFCSALSVCDADFPQT
jgi:hypothetical protein